MEYAFNPALGGRGRKTSVNLRPAWSIRAGSRTGTKATQRNPVSENKTKNNNKKRQQKGKERRGY